MHGNHRLWCEEISLSRDIEIKKLLYDEEKTKKINLNTRKMSFKGNDNNNKQRKIV